MAKELGPFKDLLKDYLLPVLVNVPYGNTPPFQISIRELHFDQNDTLDSIEQQCENFREKLHDFSQYSRNNFLFPHEIQLIKCEIPLPFASLISTTNLCLNNATKLHLEHLLVEEDAFQVLTSGIFDSLYLSNMDFQAFTKSSTLGIPINKLRKLRRFALVNCTMPDRFNFKHFSSNLLIQDPQEFLGQTTESCRFQKLNLVPVFNDYSLRVFVKAGAFSNMTILSLTFQKYAMFEPDVLNEFLSTCGSFSALKKLFIQNSEVGCEGCYILARSLVENKFEQLSVLNLALSQLTLKGTALLLIAWDEAKANKEHIAKAGEDYGLNLSHCYEFKSRHFVQRTARRLFELNTRVQVQLENEVILSY